MYKQVSTSSEQKIIGVTNGVYQVEIDENSLELNDNLKEINTVLNQTNVFEFLDNQDGVTQLKIESLKGSLLKKAKATDVMGYSPFYFGFSFIVSEKFIDFLKKEKVNKDEYHFFEITIDKLDDKHFFFFVPMIPTSEVVFDKSILFLEKDFLEKEKKRLEIDSLGEYQDFTMQNPFVYFEEICLNKKHKNKDIISVQATNELFFSQRLIEKLNKEDISNLILPNRQVKLIFN